VSAATAWALVALCTVITVAIKSAGPIALGGRELPARFNGVISLMAPALLAALVAVSALADGKHLAIGAETAGVAVAGLVFWRGGSVLTGVIVAAAVTALLRAL
jgi:branched-subunit amino acid transport protein